MSDTVGERLRSERVRLGVSQAVMADWAGVKKLTQLQYENDKTSPTAAYLLAVGLRGVDVAYVLGLPSKEETLTPRARALLRNYQEADKDGQSAIERMALLEAQRDKGLSGQASGDGGPLTKLAMRA